MEILFGSKQLLKSMNDSRIRAREYGELAKTIGRRLDDLEAIDSLDQAALLPGRFEPLHGDREGQFSMRLSANWRLLFVAANDPLPFGDDGALDLGRVTRIRIIGVEDYHGK